MEEKTLNFDIIKPGKMEQYQSVLLTEKENDFLKSLKDPVILSLLNEYLSEFVLKVKTYQELKSFI